ncbi:conserved phage C-terminal domain-containing protein [Aeromonas veronii]|uniref:conserved phage C-terminal domain-containing protein n=1 Tax=Aeromonas veronii TaxID=654 RepID=UPI003CF4D4F2
MGNVIRLATPVAAPIQRGCNVDENARTGFRLFYRSMKNAAWYRDVAKKSVMFHLILDVAHEQRSVVFAGKRVKLSRGQLVCSAKSLGQECGISEDQARRALEFFKADGAISCVGSRGKGGYTIVTLLNFDAYQRGLSQIFSAEYGADSEAAPAQGFEAGSLIGGADLPAEQQAEDYISKNIQNIKTDLKPSLSQLADASFDQRSEQLIAAEPVSAEPSPAEQVTAEQAADEPKARVIPEAAVQTPNGKSWGTAEDLKAAQWMFARVQRINPTALEPNWPQWANVIRLMRELDQRSHSDICELYDWVSRDPFWCANVLSPQKLRQKWDQLTAKRHTAPLHNKRPLGNLAAAQQQAQAIMEKSGVGYDDNTIL